MASGASSPSFVSDNIPVPEMAYDLHRFEYGDQDHSHTSSEITSRSTVSRSSPSSSTASHSNSYGLQSTSASTMSPDDYQGLSESGISEVQAIDTVHSTANDSDGLRCPYCPTLAPFTRKGEFKLVMAFSKFKFHVLIILDSKHINRHEPPYKCQAPTCDHRTATQRDLDRHHAAAHNIRRHNQPQYVYHCSVANCDWSPTATSNGFARRDHAKRHIDNQHLDQDAIVIQTRIQ